MCVVAHHDCRVEQLPRYLLNGRRTTQLRPREALSDAAGIACGRHAHTQLAAAARGSSVCCEP